MGSLLFAYIAMMLVQVGFVAFLLVALIFGTLAMLPQTIARFAPALFWGLVGNAASPFLVAVLYQLMPADAMMFNLLSSPMSFVHGILHEIGDWSFRYRDFLLSFLNVGAKIGFFAATYLVASRWLNARIRN